MEISVPFIKINEDKEFAKYKNIWTNFVTEYNKDKESRNQLKNQHRRVFYELVRIAKETLDFNNRILVDSPLRAVNSQAAFKIKTNRHTLNCRAFNAEKSSESVGKYIARMVEAGVIVGKQFHGTKADYDLFISPDFLLIYDFNQEDYVPTSPHLPEKLNTENRALQGVKLSNLQVLFPDVSENISIIQQHQKGVSASENISDQEQSKTSFSNKPNKKDSSNISQTEKEKSCAKKEKAGFVAGLAATFYLYMVSRLFSNHDINPTHAEKAMKYIEENYFMAEKAGYSEKELWRWWENNYKPRIDMASDYVRRHNYDVRWWFPMAYLDVNNPKGFVKTKNWLKQTEKLAQKRAVDKVANSKKLTPDEKYFNMLKLFGQKPTKENLDYCLEYVKKIIPERKEEFNQAVRRMVATA